MTRARIRPAAAVLAPPLAQWLLGDAPDRRALVVPAAASTDPAAWTEMLLPLLHAESAAVVLPFATLLALLDHARREPIGSTLLWAPVSHVLDLSCAYLPGQAVPLAAILTTGRFARATHRWSRTLAGARPGHVRVLRCAQGDGAANGTIESCRVWESIQAFYDTPGTDGRWVSVADFPEAPESVYAFLAAPRGPHAQRPRMP